MSSVRTYKVTDLSGNILVPERGSVIDLQYYRYDTKTTFTAGWNQQSGSTNTHPLVLRLDNVDDPNNIIVCEWMLSGEENYTSEFGLKVARNGSIVSSNFGAGSAENYPLWWQNYANFGFDGNNDSTPHSIRILYMGRAGSTGVVNYSLWMGHGGQSSGTYFVNRPVGSTGQDDYETGVCTGIIYEIASNGGTGES